MKKLALFCLLLVLAPSLALANVKIIAVVNGESITNVQLEQRTKIIVSAANLPNNPETQTKIKKQALEILINEILQKQEAYEKGIQLTEKEFAYALKDLEQKNNLKEGGFKNFITSKGINYDATIEQIKAGLIWKKVIARFIQPRIYVTDEEVASKAKSFTAKDIKSEAEVYEIIVPIDYGDDKGAKEKAQEIIKKARAGEDFSALAKKYSVGKTAQAGGLVGVINEASVVGPIKELLESTKEGEISEPKKIQSFYVVIKVNERRVFNPKNDLAQIKNMVIMEKIEQESKTYVKKLREKAYIERR